MSKEPQRVPTLSAAQVREADRLAAEEFGIPVDWLMEAAGWQCARMCRGKTAVVCGRGNNAGDGLAAARHLHRWGRLQSVSCVDRASLTGSAAREAVALERSGVEIQSDLRLSGATIVLDALLGTGINRAPKGPFAEWITAVNASGLRVIAVDIPSGLDADSGRAYDPCIAAHTTITLGLPKPGLLTADGARLSGELWIADIGIPLAVYARIGVEVPQHLFSMHDRVQMEALRL